MTPRFLASLAAAMGLSLAGSTVHAASSSASGGPVVLELFTSQSCSSCPSADALLKRISESDPNVILLSYHVDYWDHLSWKDTYSSPANTARQRDYATAMRSARVFTPQLIVGGTASLTGSDERGIAQAIAKAKPASYPLRVAIVPQGDALSVTVTPQANAPQAAELWEIRYDRYAKTQVKAGENGGRTLESVNNVTHIKKLGTWTSQTTASITLEPLQDDGITILAQVPGQGPLLGAARYQR